MWHVLSMYIGMVQCVLLYVARAYIIGVARAYIYVACAYIL